jgi:hypothetical protein
MPLKGGSWFRILALGSFEKISKNNKEGITVHG